MNFLVFLLLKQSCFYKTTVRVDGSCFPIILSGQKWNLTSPGLTLQHLGIYQSMKPEQQSHPGLRDPSGSFPVPTRPWKEGQQSNPQLSKPYSLKQESSLKQVIISKILVHFCPRFKTCKRRKFVSHKVGKGLHWALYNLQHLDFRGILRKEHF